jgi:DNA-binding transcriptional ArsR family regulator
MGGKVYWISKPEQLRALKSPLRHDILDRLTALGPLPVRSIAAALGRQPTAIYRHLRMLERVGLVVAVETSGTRGRPANIYRTIAPLVRLARAPRDPRNRKVMASIARSTAAHAAREYGEAFAGSEWRIEGPQRNHWFFRLHTAPSRPKLARINALLDQLAELIWTPDPKPGPLLHVTWMMSPARAPKKHRATRSK